MFPPNTYTWPDGTKSVRKPRDGEVFTIYKGQVLDSAWQYDDMMSKWVRTGYYVPPEQDEPAPDTWNPYRWHPPKCECGAEKVGHPGHSYWCEKYTRS